MRKRYAFALSLLFILTVFNQVTLFSIKELDQELESVVVLRVIDGDTLELSDSRVIRLANINSPEKNSPLSEQSKSFLKSFENQTLKMQSISTDKYGRVISKIYSDLYINEFLVSQGLASKFLVQEDELNLFSESEKRAIENQLGIWTHSQYYGCFDIYVDSEKEYVSISSSCPLPSTALIGFYLKDESRKIYKFQKLTTDSVIVYTKNGQDNLSELFWNSETNIWNNDRDTAYLFDKDNNIAGYYSYGY